MAEVLPAMRLDELLLETDSPYLPPVPYRGKRNESGYLPLICERIAAIYGISPDEVAETTARASGRYSATRSSDVFHSRSGPVNVTTEYLLR